MLSSGNISLYLYQEFCPNRDAKHLSLIWVDHESFDISIFRLGYSNFIKFNCNVRIFWDSTALKQNCTNKNIRKKRNDYEIEEGIVFFSIFNKEINNYVPKNSENIFTHKNFWLSSIFWVDSKIFKLTMYKIYH